LNEDCGWEYPFTLTCWDKDFGDCCEDNFSAILLNLSETHNMSSIYPCCWDVLVTNIPQYTCDIGSLIIYNSNDLNVPLYSVTENPVDFNGSYGRIFTRFCLPQAIGGDTELDLTIVFKDRNGIPICSTTVDATCPGVNRFDPPFQPKIISLNENSTLENDSEITILPNPSNGSIEILIPNIESVVGIKVNDIKGNIVFNSNFEKSGIKSNKYIIDLNNTTTLPSGIYLLEIVYTNRTEIKKFSVVK